MTRNSQSPKVRPRMFIAAGVFGALTLVAVLAGPMTPAQTASASNDARSVLIRLPSANGNEGYGRAKLIETGTQTRVVVAAHGVSTDMYIPAIHEGTCAVYSGTPVFPLAAFEFGDRSRTTVDVTFDELISGQYLIDIHLVTENADDLFDPASAVACGQLAEIGGEVEPEPTIAPADEDELVVTAPPVTGIGPIDGGYWSTITAAVLAAMAIVFAGAGLDLRRRSLVTVAQRRLFRLTGREF